MMGEVLGWALSLTSLGAGVALGFQAGVAEGILKEQKRRALQDEADLKDPRSLAALKVTYRQDSVVMKDEYRNAMLWHATQHFKEFRGCSFCGHDKYSVACPERGTPFNEDGSVGGSVTPTIAIICTKCSWTQTFAWLEIWRAYQESKKKAIAA